MREQSIAVGIITNQKNQILISKRNVDKHLAGLWEFPGGKLEQNESFKLALRRELFEEIGITVKAVIKVLEMQHDYDDRILTFQFFKVTDYSGEVQARENQIIRWVNISELSEFNFPEANNSIINAMTLPDNYMIADEHVYCESIIPCTERQLNNGVSVIQHRSMTSVSRSAYQANAIKIKKLCERHNAKYIANCPLDWMDEIHPHGIHLTSKLLATLSEKSFYAKKYDFFSASCHNEREVAWANNLGVKCILIGPVNITQSHPSAEPIGWKRFSQLCSLSKSPVYALGGLQISDIKSALIYGAQGIASIRAFM